MFLDRVVFGLFSIVAFFLQKRIKEGVDPPEGSERDTAFKKNRGFMRDVVKSVIAQRREGGGDEHIPFIDNLLQSGVPDDQAREMITTHMYLHARCAYVYVGPSQVVDDAVTFMIGGFHTSGNFIVWMMWYLAGHPEVQERIVEELETETEGESGDRLKTYALKVATAYST